MSLAGSAGGGFELIELCIALVRELPPGGFPVQVHTRTIVKARVQVFPHRHIGIAQMRRGSRSFGDTQINQQTVKE